MGIKINNLYHTYEPGTKEEYPALKNISLDIKKGSFTAIIGKTGSGKSSLLQHLNAILLPQQGYLQINDFIIEASKKKKSYKQLRKEIGLVFQFSEYQLFEETIIKDVMFGPKNFGASEQEAYELACKYLEIVNIDKSLYDHSPFQLSGGQARRVAIAGILAMQPDIIVLDEPTASLDPQGAIDIMNTFLQLKERDQKTLILVSHDINFVYEYAQEIILLDKGELILHKETTKFFNDPIIEKYNVTKPNLLCVYEHFKKQKAQTKITYPMIIDLLKDVIKDA